MPYSNVLNRARGLGRSDAVELTREFNLLRAELDDIRTKYAAVVTLLVTGTAVGAGYGTGTALAAKQFTPS